MDTKGGRALLIRQGHLEHVHMKVHYVVVAAFFSCSSNRGPKKVSCGFDQDAFL